MRKTVVVLSVIFISLALGWVNVSSAVTPATESEEVTADSADEAADTAAQSASNETADTSAEGTDTAVESAPAEMADKSAKMTDTAAEPAPAETEAASAETTEQGVSHEVTKGDTLWDISDKYYQNPWIWPKIWEANKLQIANPHWIYPNQVLVIPDKSVLIPRQAAEAPQAEEVQPAVQEKVEEQKAEESSAKEEVQQEAAAETQEVEKETEQVAVEPVLAAQEEPAEQEQKLPMLKKIENTGKYFQEESFIAPEYWEGDGLIIGDKGKKLLISSGDTVFLNLGSDKVRPGMTCMVYRKIGKFIDPSTRDFLGYEVHRIGRLEITDGVADQTATGKVVMSHDPIKIGDIVVVVRQK